MSLEQSGPGEAVAVEDDAGPPRPEGGGAPHRPAVLGRTRQDRAAGRILRTTVATAQLVVALALVPVFIAVKPRRLECFNVSKDPKFVEKLRDAVGLYVSPPEKAIVFPSP
jgi:hypothetical protein